MASCPEGFIIRDLMVDECEQLLDMMFDLADYTGERDLIVNTEEDLRQDIFGKPTRCQVIVAERTENGENKKCLVGYCLYFQAYCSWKRSYLYIEDIFVQETHRGKGLGKSLYQCVVRTALDLDFHKVEVMVLPFNTNAKGFYQKMGAVDQTDVDGRHRMKLTREKMHELVAL